MTTMDVTEHKRSSTEKVSVEEELPGSDTKIGVDSFDASEADEALQLVGTLRTVEFSEEYNQALRKKLVCDLFYLIARATASRH